MPESSLARPILGGVAVVLLSGVSAYFGAGLAQREPSPVELRPAVGPVDSAAIDAVERRLGYVERRLDAIEVRAAAAGDPESAPSSADPVPGTAQGASPVPPPTTELPPPEDPQKVLAETTRSLLRASVVERFKLLTVTGTEGQSRRLAQAVGDTTQIINLFGLRGDDVLDRVRKVVHNEWETGAREVGPLVHDGLGRADIATVRERMHEIWTETDRGLRPLFDDEGWKVYEEKTGALRKVYEEVLSDYEKARLGGK